MNFARSSISMPRKGSVAKARSDFRDAVEPGLAHAVPGGFFRNAAIDGGETQPTQAGKLAHELRMAPVPMREEFLAS